MSNLKYVGLGITGSKYLTLYIDQTVNCVVHPSEVKIPWSDLVRDEVAYHVNLATAHRLRLEWENPPPWRVDDPLPGIG